MTTKVVGQRITRVDGPAKVTGQATYVADIMLPNMLHCKVLRSPHPHARIMRINTEKAQALPGVKTVVTGKDVPYMHGRQAIQDYPFLAQDKVRFVGEIVAAVAALDEETAEQAVQLIEVDYEELPAVFDPLESFKPTAPVIHEHLGEYWRVKAALPVPGTNICNHFKLRKGNIAEGFATAEVVHEEWFSLPMMQHVPLEPLAVIAQYDHSGVLTVWDSTQSANIARQELSEAMDIPMNKVRIIVPYVGGGFGAKHTLKAEPVVVALALHCKGRPIRWVHTRAETFVNSITRQGAAIRIKSGVNRDGTLVAREVECFWDTGAYADMGPMIARNTGYACAGPYVIPHVKVDSYCLYTNKPVAGAYRGFGIAESGFAYESHMDRLAELISMDPIQFRMKNALQEGSISITGEEMFSVGLKECLRSAVDAVGWQRQATNDHGRGVGLFYKSTGTPTSSAAFCKLNEDGTLTVLNSGTEMGQGLHTILTQIAAEELGISADQVSVQNPDTEFTPYDSRTTSSRAAFHIGNAVRLAARDVRQQILALVAEQVGADPADLTISDSVVQVKNRPDQSVPLNKLWVTGFYATKGQEPILGRGAYYTADLYDPIDPETGQSKRISAFWMYGAQAAEVNLDRETGLIQVTKLVAAHDVGKALNPLTCEQQIEGGVVMGMGTVLSEELIFDNGRIVNASLADYKIPSSLDINEVTALLVEVPHPDGPFGAKGVGEPGLAATAPAIANALYQLAGIRLHEIPLTPERVWRALQQQAREH